MKIRTQNYCFAAEEDVEIPENWKLEKLYSARVNSMFSLHSLKEFYIYSSKVYNGDCNSSGTEKTIANLLLKLFAFRNPCLRCEHIYPSPHKYLLRASNKETKLKNCLEMHLNID